MSWNTYTGTSQATWLDGSSGHAHAAARCTPVMVTTTGATLTGVVGQTGGQGSPGRHGLLAGGTAGPPPGVDPAELLGAEAVIGGTAAVVTAAEPPSGAPSIGTGPPSIGTGPL